jgi:hypothetical protein
VPEYGIHLNTLGVAQYRSEKYQEALETLAKADRLNSTSFGGSIPADLAFIAMAHHRLGHRAEAKATLHRLRTAMKDSRWSGDGESRSFLHETEALIDAPPTADTERNE